MILADMVVEQPDKFNVEKISNTAVTVAFCIVVTLVVALIAFLVVCAIKKNHKDKIKTNIQDDNWHMDE